MRPLLRLINRARIVGVVITLYKLTKEPRTYQIARVHPGHIETVEGYEIMLPNFLMGWALNCITLGLDRDLRVEFGYGKRGWYAEIL